MNNVLYFEQVGASSHTSLTKRVLIDKLFGKMGWILLKNFDGKNGKKW